MSVEQVLATLEKVELFLSYTAGTGVIDITANVIGKGMPEDERERTVWNVERIVKDLIDEKTNHLIRTMLNEPLGGTMKIKCSTYDESEDEGEVIEEFEENPLAAGELGMEELSRTSLGRVASFRLVEEDDPERGYRGRIDELMIGRYPSDKTPLTPAEQQQVGDKFIEWYKEQLRDRQEQWYQTLDEEMSEGPVLHCLPDVEVVMGNIRTVDVEAEEEAV